MRPLLALLVVLAACDQAAVGTDSGSNGGNGSIADGSNGGTDIGDGSNGGTNSGSDTDDAQTCCRPDASVMTYAGDLEEGVFKPYGVVPNGPDRFSFATCGDLTVGTESTPWRFDAAGCCPETFEVDRLNSSNRENAPDGVFHLYCKKPGDCVYEQTCPVYVTGLEVPGWYWEKTGTTTFEWRERHSCASFTYDDAGKITEVDASGCCPAGSIATAPWGSPYGVGISCVAQ